MPPLAPEELRIGRRTDDVAHRGRVAMVHQVVGAEAKGKAIAAKGTPALKVNVQIEIRVVGLCEIGIS